VNKVKSSRGCDTWFESDSEKVFLIEIGDVGDGFIKDEIGKGRHVETS